MHFVPAFFERAEACAGGAVAMDNVEFNVLHGAIGLVSARCRMRKRQAVTESSCVAHQHQVQLLQFDCFFRACRGLRGCSCP